MQEVRGEDGAYLYPFVRGEFHLLGYQGIKVLVNPVGGNIYLLSERHVLIVIRIKYRSYDLIIVIDLGGYPVQDSNKGIPASTKDS